LFVDDPPELSAEATTLADLEEVEHRARLFRLVEQLPADQRRVIAMRFAEENSIREIARELRRTEGAVKQLQFRALQNLRAQLEPSKPQQTQSNSKRNTKPGGKDA
jgi:RNA polymerase sigma-70 factor (ECF subfamily)